VFSLQTIRLLLQLGKIKPDSYVFTEAVAFNPNITLKFYEEFKEHLGTDIARNKFNYHPVLQKRIKRCQYQARRWLGRRDRKARIIQMYCHDWLWKPLCKDGTIGIRPRLDSIYCHSLLST
jgi:hypothetical protein